MVKRKITLSKFDQHVLKQAAHILDRIPEDEAYNFSLNSYDDTFTLTEQAENLRDMVGYASGAYQYDRPIGPETKPISFDEMRERYWNIAISTLQANLDMEAVNRVYNSEFTK